MKQFEFTFKTEKDYNQARMTGYIDSYQMVRIEKSTDTYSIDYPIHSLEEYNNTIEKMNEANIQYKAYQSTHSYDIQDYL